MQALQGRVDKVLSVAWSPDGKQLASGTADDTVCIWDAETGECVEALREHGGYAVQWSPSGKQFASAARRATRIVDTETWECVQTLRGFANSEQSIRWFPDGEVLAVRVYGLTTMVITWATETWEELDELIWNDLSRGQSGPVPDPLAEHSVAPFVRTQLLALPEYGECSICSEAVARRWAYKIFIAKCGHWFHRACLRRWYDAQGQRFSCPNCRSS